MNKSNNSSSKYLKPDETDMHKLSGEIAGTEYDDKKMDNKGNPISMDVRYGYTPSESENSK